MTDWTAGYNAEVDYTTGYYPELNPLRCNLSLLNNGIRPPKIEAACELGYGQGLSTNIHAAANTTTNWWGTDFMPTQAGFAQELADISSSDAKLFEESFSEFCSRGDLPDFDYIGLHGIWSWISDENRNVIVDFVRRKLKAGGILYLCYNSLPGWSSFAPVRYLMKHHADINGSVAQGTLRRIENSLEFAKGLIETNPAFARAHPAVVSQIEELMGKDRRYLAHEYFNEEWHPMHFSSVVNLLEPAKLSFACPANVLDQIDNINLSPEQINFIKGITDNTLRETTRDFIVNKRFRRDYWIKGLRRLSSLERSEALIDQKFVLILPKDNVSLKLNTQLGEISMNEDLYVPLVDAMSDYSPISVADLFSQVKAVKKTITVKEVAEALMMLNSTGAISPAQDLSLSKQCQNNTIALNHYLMQRSRSDASVAHLASPVTGGGINLSSFHQLCLLVYQNGAETSIDVAKAVVEILSKQGKNFSMTIEGVSFTNPEESLKDLEAEAKKFLDKYLPMLKGLQIAS